MSHSAPTRPAAIAAMVCSAAVGAQFVAGKATRDALFLATADVTTLPSVVAVTAACSIVFVALSSWALRRRSPEQLVPLAFGVNGVLLALAWLLAGTHPRPVAWALYLQISGLGPVLGSGFWLLVSERFHPRAARRHFGQIAGVGTLAGLGGALVAERVGALLDVTAMLPLLAALSGTCAMAIRRFVRVQPAGPQFLDIADAPELDVQSPRSGVRALAHAPYLQNLAALVFLGTVAAAILDYVFKASAVAFLGRGDTLLRFFAIYYAGVGLLTFVVQTVGSGIALERLGLSVTASTPSIVAVAGALGALVFPGLQGAMIARGGESVFRGSLFKVGYEIFFTPIQAQDRRAAKSIIDVGFDRLGDAAGGGLVAALLVVPVVDHARLLLLAAAGCSVLGLVAALRLSRGYIKTLEESLLHQAGGLELPADGSMGASVLRTLQLQAGDVARPDAASDHPTERLLVDDPDLRRIAALRSRNVDRVRDALGVRELNGVLVPPAVALLAWDAVAEDAITALRRVAEEHVGQFHDALLDPNQPFAVRRRLARVFAVCVSQRAADALLHGLEDSRFEVRFHCGRSLATIVERNAVVRVEPEPVFNLVRREVAVGRPVWEGQRLLDEVQGERFVDAYLRQRAGQSLAHVFTLLSLVLPSVPLQIAYRGLQTDDAALRSTALEYLESVLPRDIRDRLWPFLDDQPAPHAAPRRSREEVLEDLMRSNDSIMLNLRELRERLSSDPLGRDA